jgi:hypothetical protein
MEAMFVQGRASVSEFALVAQEALAKGNLPVALGALRSRDGARLQLIETMRDVGVLPRDSAWLGFQMEGLVTGEAAVDVLERRGVPDDVIAEFVRELHCECRYRSLGFSLR